MGLQAEFEFPLRKTNKSRLERFTFAKNYTEGENNTKNECVRCKDSHIYTKMMQ